MESCNATASDSSRQSGTMTDCQPPLNHSETAEHCVAIAAPAVVTSTSGGLDDASAVKPLSKKQQKHLKQHELWLSRKSERRVMRKEKRKEKRREKVENGVETGPTRKMLKKNTMKGSTCRISVAIDLSFDDLMSEKDINKMSQQIQFCYSSNRRASQPVQFYLTSLGAKTQQRLDHIGDYRGWDIHTEQRAYDEVFSRDNVVYLTSDSPNILEKLEPSKAYIIGGLVDHNHHKGLCFELAVKRGINHARLPIDEYVQMNSRRVLTINHVFEILLRFTETTSWKDAFFHVIPKRKQVEPAKDQTGSVDVELSPTEISSGTDVSRAIINAANETDDNVSAVTLQQETDAMSVDFSEQCKQFEGSEKITDS